MIYITGDTHGNHDIAKLFPGSFPDGKTTLAESGSEINGMI